MDKEKNEKFLHQMEVSRRHQVLLDNLPGIAFRCHSDKHWSMEFISKEFENITGYSIDEFMKIKKGRFNKLIYPSDRNKVFKEVSTAIEKNKPYEIKYRILTRDKQIKWVWEKGRLVRDLKTNNEYIEGLILDITAQKTTELKLKKLTRYDLMTGLANKDYLHEFLNRRLHAIDKNRNSVAVIVLSINQHYKIKEMYDKTGLKKLYNIISKNLQNQAEASDFIAYIEDGRFVYVKSFSKENLYNIGYQIDQLLQDISKKLILNKEPIYNGLSAGLSVYPEDTLNYKDLISNAIFACRRAQTENPRKVNLLFFEKKLFQQYQKQLKIEKGIITALENHQFYLEYQPIVDIQTNQIHALEVLVRWDYPELGLIPPSLFIEIAEKNNLIDRLENWVVKQALSEFHDKILPLNPKIKLSVNLSPTHLINNKIEDLFSKYISEFQINPQSIIIEITETSLDVIDNNNSSIKYFIDNGYSLAMDDFGTGQSSLERLATIPFRKIKIDKSLINKINHKTAAYLIKNIITLSHKIGVKIVAEGIELQKQLNLLKEYGCDYGQGYLLAKPMNLSELLSHKISALDFRVLSA
ncbi:EAL domain-containing protein (plasmid) [Legionella israelensis]|uniref:bifunctional diguanylate cyclase/phosphodiesterase n=1 Tax=Legionella israelensis TaxID=454 RepID=UPI00117CEA93|nr:EAL domain-containing protein [Legionella israelensis]QDP73702.1 EAL domain-containing protein [Legionella israelensis]